MSVSFEHKLLQTKRRISNSFIIDTSPHYNYYDTVSARFEHTLRRRTQNLALLIQRRAKTIITTSQSASNTRSFLLTDIFACRQLYLIHRHTTFIITCRWCSKTLFNVLSILSRHSLRSAAIFRTSPILDTSKRNNYYIKVSVWFEHPITSCPIYSILSSHSLHHVSHVVT